MTHILNLNTHQIYDIVDLPNEATNRSSATTTILCTPHLYRRRHQPGAWKSTTPAQSPVACSLPSPNTGIRSRPGPTDPIDSNPFVTPLPSLQRRGLEEMTSLNIDLFDKTNISLKKTRQNHTNQEQYDVKNCQKYSLVLLFFFFCCFPNPEPPCKLSWYHCQPSKFSSLSSILFSVTPPPPPLAPFTARYLDAAQLHTSAPIQFHFTPRTLATVLFPSSSFSDTPIHPDHTCSRHQRRPKPFSSLSIESITPSPWQHHQRRPTRRFHSALPRQEQRALPPTVGTVYRPPSAGTLLARSKF